jgi:hypothetical protein
VTTPKVKSLAACVAAIKRLNARFRRLKKKDGPLALRLAQAKDRLIDAMAALCAHPEVIGTNGTRSYGAMGVPVGPRRLCRRCGLCEVPREGAYQSLEGKRSRTLPFDDYLVEQGKVLKRLGINI